MTNENKSCIVELRDLAEPKGVDLLKKLEHYQISRLRKNPSKLFKLLSDVPQLNKRNKGFYGNELCLYDGIKLRSYDRSLMEWLISQKQFKFNTTATYNGAVIGYLGGYTYSMPGETKKKEFKIDIHLVPGPNKWAVDFSGSLHMWSNKGRHNYNDFYWKDFLKVYDEMVAVFQFDPTEVEVVNLEVGVNCEWPNWMKITIPEMMVKIISLFEGKKKKDNEEKYRDSYKEDKGDRYVKVYYKSLQNKLNEQILRLELGYQRARSLNKDSGVTMFCELTEISNLFKYRQLLKKAFEKLHMCPPDLSHIPTEDIEASRQLAEYRTSSFWSALKKTDRRKYKKARLNQESLIEKYSPFNLTKDVQRLLDEKLK